jgi:hypothetical protein
MAGSLVPVMYCWAIRTTLCSALRSDAEQLPYQLGFREDRDADSVELTKVYYWWGAETSTRQVTFYLFSFAGGPIYWCIPKSYPTIVP